MMMYLWGEYEMDAHPSTSSSAKPRLKQREAFRHLGWLFLGDAEIPGEIVKRAQAGSGTPAQTRSLRPARMA